MFARPGPRKALFDTSHFAQGKGVVMAVITEMAKAKQGQSMSLDQIRRQLDKSRWNGHLDPDQRDQLQAKLRQIMTRLAKISRRGGPFAQVKPSRELTELYQRTRWA